MRVYKIKPACIFIVIYLIPIIQIVTGEGVIIENIIVGLFPFTFLYFAWLYLLYLALVSKVSDYTKQYHNMGTTKKLLIFNIAIVLPFNWVYTNMMHNGLQSSIMMLLGGVFFFVFIYGLLSAWTTISKCLYVIENNSDHKVNYKNYFYPFMLYFLLGPITIWFLQPRIQKILER